VPGVGSRERGPDSSGDVRSSGRTPAAASALRHRGRPLDARVTRAQRAPWGFVTGVARVGNARGVPRSTVGRSSLFSALRSPHEDVRPGEARSIRSRSSASSVDASRSAMASRSSRDLRGGLRTASSSSCGRRPRRSPRVRRRRPSGIAPRSSLPHPSTGRSSSRPVRAARSRVVYVGRPHVESPAPIRARAYHPHSTCKAESLKPLKLRPGDAATDYTLLHSWFAASVRSLCNPQNFASNPRDPRAMPRSLISFRRCFVGRWKRSSRPPSFQGRGRSNAA
jgi:hypothetical protein